MLRPGARIGGLRIEALLGRGAMGEVYRATQLALDRPVAVKRIAEHLLAQPEALARFEREAKCLARVQSQHVVAVHDFGRMREDDGGEHFLLVMELVEGGRSLRSAVGAAMPWAPATALVLHAAQGLAAAAELGVVHRDVKPDNILVTGRGVAKLADFGLARSVDSSEMTAQGAVLGTPTYMPPEACRGETADARGDIYSLGAVWYHLLAGKPPFQAANATALLRRHLDDAPAPIAELAPSTPAQVAALVHRCLAKDPAQRPQSATALVSELRVLAGAGLVLPETAPLPEPAVPADDPATAATRVPSTATAQVGTASTLPITASTAPTVVLPGAEPPKRRRARRAAIVLGALAAAGVTAAILALVLRDPLRSERARVDHAITAGDLGVALRLADAMVARWPDRSEALDADRVVIGAEIDRAIAAGEFDRARETLAERRRSREWLDGEPYAVAIEIAQARAIAPHNWDDAAKRFGELRQRHPQDLDIATALIDAIGADNAYPLVIGAVLQLDRAGKPLAPGALAALVRYQRVGEPYGDTGTAVRAALLRHRPESISEAHALLAHASHDEIDARIAAWMLLQDGHALTPEEELRHHAAIVAELDNTYGAARDSLAWLQKAALAPDWAARKAAAKPPAFSDVKALHDWNEHESTVEDLLVRAFPDELRPALPKWLADTDDERVRWNAWRIAHRIGAETPDPWAFHAETLRTFNPFYDSEPFEQALAYFKDQLGGDRSDQARAALQVGVDHVEELAANIERNMPTNMGKIRARDMRKVGSKIRDVLSPPTDAKP
jgi:tRNA A-37 threonylcarbamoyl transferase component Bud32